MGFTNLAECCVDQKVYEAAFCSAELLSKTWMKTQDEDAEHR